MPYQQNDWGGNALDNYLIGKVGRREFCVAHRSSAEERCGCHPAGQPCLRVCAAATTGPTTLPEPRVTADPNDPRIKPATLANSTGPVSMLGYLSRPKEGGPNPTVLVINENRGLLPHFPDVARRYAQEG